MRIIDLLPEILDGHDVFDFNDADILQRLEELEQEEGIWQAEAEDEDYRFRYGVERQTDLFLTPSQGTCSLGNFQLEKPKGVEYLRDWVTICCGVHLVHESTL